MYKYEFDTNRKRVEFCPCGRSNHDGKFVPYVGYTDKGYCYKCPKLFYPDGPASKLVRPEKNKIKPIIPVSYISPKVLKQSLGKYDENTLFQFLIKLTNAETAEKIRKDYFIGTSRFWQGSTVFWQIDAEGKIRSGKILQYAMRPAERCSIGINCGRVKTNEPSVKWVHKLMKEKDFKLKQCFFGEHLLRIYPKRKVGILESEKSALIAAAYNTDIVWLACGGVGGLSNEKTKVLEGRNVVLFPDLKMYEVWKERADNMCKKLKKATTSISDYLERTATADEKKDGLDLADFLIREDWRMYGKHG